MLNVFVWSMRPESPVSYTFTIALISLVCVRVVVHQLRIKESSVGRGVYTLPPLENLALPCRLVGSSGTYLTSGTRVNDPITSLSRRHLS
jgi:hypothetical protein